MTRITTSTLIHRYVAERIAVGALNRRSAKRTRVILNRFAEHAPHYADAISKRTAVAFMAGMSNLSANSRAQYQGVARRFCDWLRSERHITTDPFRDVPPPRKPRAVHRALAHEQILRLLVACATPRDRLIVLFTVHTGLRRKELADLEVGDVNLTQRTVTVLHGKGGHQRVVPLSAEAAAVVADYLAGEGASEGPLLRSLRDPRAGISPDRVGVLFRAVAERAGVKHRAWDGVGVHSLRHTMASDCYARSRDVLAVGDLLGHLNLNTTRRYVVGLSVEHLRDAVEGRSYLARRKPAA